MSILTSRITVGIAGVVFGAAVTALVLGASNLQSQNAAAWASATATFMAAVVALWVGLTPELNRRRASAARAIATLQWAESAIGTQLIHLGFALNLMESRYFHADEVEKLRRDLGVLDSASLKALIDHVEGLDPNVAKLAWRCIIDVDRASQLAAGLVQPPQGSVVDLGSNFADVFVDVFISMDEARRAFAMQVYGKFEAVETPQRVIQAQNLKQRSD